MSLPAIDAPAVPLIRSARLDDAARLAQLAGELGYSASERQIRERLEHLSSSRDHAVCVAETVDGTVSGWIAVERRLLLESGFKAEITGLVVALQARRTGVGQALVLVAERWATELGLEIMIVRSNIARTESHLFYRDIGYDTEKTQQVYRKRL